MNKFFKMFGVVGMLAGMLMVAGCGDDDPAPAVVSKDTAVPATVVGAVATTTAVVNATPSGSTVVAASIPTGTAITATAGTMPANPEIKISTPTNGTTSGVPATGGLNLSTSNGAVDISIPGVTAFTTSNPVTVKIPVANTTGLVDNAANVPVTAVKADGTVVNYTGTYSAAAGTVTVNGGVTNFCWFIIKPTWVSPTGATGSPGTTQQ